MQLFDHSDSVDPYYNIHDTNKYASECSQLSLLGMSPHVCSLGRLGLLAILICLQIYIVIPQSFYSAEPIAGWIEWPINKTRQPKPFHLGNPEAVRMLAPGTYADETRARRAKLYQQNHISPNRFCQHSRGQYMHVHAGNAGDT